VPSLLSQWTQVDLLYVVPDIGRSRFQPCEYFTPDVSDLIITHTDMPKVLTSFQLTNLRANKFAIYHSLLTILGSLPSILHLGPVKGLVCSGKQPGSGDRVLGEGGQTQAQADRPSRRTGQAAASRAMRSAICLAVGRSVSGKRTQLSPIAGEKIAFSKGPADAVRYPL
jgi:hypothetical protein